MEMRYHLLRSFALAIVLTGVLVLSEDRPALEILPQGKEALGAQVGGDFALSCWARGKYPRQISRMQWWDPKDRLIDSNYGKSTITVHLVPNEDALALLFRQLSRNDAGKYTCRATYDNTEQLNTSVILTTYEDIAFVDAPEFQSAIVGTDYMIKCKVEGNPSPTVSWERNGRSVESDGRFVVENDGLLVRNVQSSDDGEYKCSALVFNTGKLKTHVIKLEVLVPPSIEPMEDVSVVEGESEVVRCKGSGKPPPTYTWIKESTSQDLSKTDRFDVKANTGDLYMNRVEFNDNSVYKCIAQNSGGRTEINVRINVLVKPKIYELLNSTTNTGVGTTVQIVCKTQGTPPPLVTLRKVSNREVFRIGAQSDDNRIVIENEIVEEKRESITTLSITNVSRSDDGLYECVAENKVGKAYKNGHITVEFPPTFERTQNYTLMVWSWAQRPGNLTCLPEAMPNATVVWKYRGLEIRKSRNFDIVTTGPQSNLVVLPQNDYNFYTTYECLATNKHGSSSLFIQLKRGEVPGVVGQVRAESLTATSIKFDIQAPKYFDTLPIRTIIVQFKREGDISWALAANHTWSYNAPYILEDLIPEVTYNFRFAASNDVGIGGFLNAPPISMPRRSEPAEPKIFLPHHSFEEDDLDDVGAGGGTEGGSREDTVTVSPYADHFELHWNVPNDNGEPIDGYTIRYCMTEKINGEWRDKDCSEEIKQSFQYTTYEINSLMAETVYRIELRAHNAIGASSPAQIRIRTARGMDSAIPFTEPSVSSGAIIGIVIGVVLLVLFVVDLACFCVNRAGIVAFFCTRSSTKHHHHSEEDPKLGSYKAAPAHPNSLNLPHPVKLVPPAPPPQPSSTSPSSLVMDEREPLQPPITNGQINGGVLEKAVSVEFDGKHVYSRPGEYTGKHSIV